MKDAASIYVTFETFEERAADFSFILHERFVHLPPLSQFWTEMALQELQHASVLRFCRERRLFNTAGITEKMVARVGDQLNAAARIISTEHVTVDEAFHAALLLESSELDAAYETLSRQLSGPYFMLQRAVESNTRDHHLRFADAAAEFSTDPALAGAFQKLLKKLH